jgi:hypothetical protein
MNNNKSVRLKNKDFILENLFSNDDDVYKKIYDLIDNPYQKKINIINMLLDSDIKLNLNKHTDIIKFFNWLSPLNIENNLSSLKWNVKKIQYANRKKILLQNSILKSNSSNLEYLNYISKIKKILNNSGVKYHYFEYKSKRFTKIKDIILVFNL